MSEKKLDISEKIMFRIKNGQIKMKPRWYFILGSVGMIVGLIALTIVSIFLISFFTFSLRTHGPMAAIRYRQILSDFPIWAPVVAILGLTAGVLMLKKYDFSYKKNFPLIVAGIIISVILAGVLIDYLNINFFLMGRGAGQRLFQKYDGGLNHGRQYRWQGK